MWLVNHLNCDYFCVQVSRATVYSSSIFFIIIVCLVPSAFYLIESVEEVMRDVAMEAYPEDTSGESKHCSRPRVINYMRTSLRGLPYKSDFNFHHCV